jgi:hypothetical protein
MKTIPMTTNIELLRIWRTNTGLFEGYDIGKMARWYSIEANADGQNRDICILARALLALLDALDQPSWPEPSPFTIHEAELREDIQVIPLPNGCYWERSEDGYGELQSHYGIIRNAEGEQISIDSMHLEEAWNLSQAFASLWASKRKLAD